MTAYYNEIDPYAAAWLRNLITAGHIAPGIVDERSIEDVRPSDLAGFRQCHFFAGVGVWSLALRRAGWSDDRSVWTGSCPCQPFSAAGAGAGFDDERHLWPHFHWLIEQCRPPVVIGEQVASKDADPWIDLVQDDLEALDYAFGAVPFPSAGIGAPHIRDRLYWVADSQGKRRPGQCVRAERGLPQDRATQDRGACGLADSILQQRPDGQPRVSSEHDQAGRVEGAAAIAGLRGAGGLGNADSDGAGRQFGGIHCSQAGEGGRGRSDDAGAPGAVATAGPTNSLWRAADWLLCRDGKWRPVEPGTFPLANAWAGGSRVGMLRAAGNAINLGAAQTFIESVM